MISQDRETAWALSKQIPIAMNDEVLSGLANLCNAARRLGIINQYEFDDLSEFGRIRREELRKYAGEATA